MPKPEITLFQHKGLKCKHLHKLNIISYFTSTGLLGFHNKLEHVHDPEHIHVVEGPRFHWTAEVTGFKWLFCLSLRFKAQKSHPVAQDQYKR